MPTTQLSNRQIADDTVVRADLNVTTPGSAVVRKVIAGAGISFTQTGVDAGTGDVTINATGGGGVDSRAPKLDTDFTHANAVQNDFLIAIIGTGASFSTVAIAAALSPNHPGVLQWRSGTTANSGVQCSTLLTSFRLGGGEQWDFNFRTAPVFTTVTLRSGASDSITSVAPVDGLYFEMALNGNIIGVGRSNSVQTLTPTIATLAVSTWYHGRISLNAAGTSATFSVYDDAGTLLGTQVVASNIPVAAGRELGWLTIMTSSGTVAIELGHIDRQVLTNPGRAVARGAA